MYYNIQILNLTYKNCVTKLNRKLVLFANVSNFPILFNKTRNAIPTETDCKHIERLVR